MSLVVMAMSCLEKVGYLDPKTEGEGLDSFGEDVIWAVNFEEFVSALSPLEYGAVYECEIEFEMEPIGYQGFNDRRSEIYKKVLGLTADEVWKDLPGHQGKPFHDLLNFCDSEGIMGSDACKRLLKDFEAHKDQVMEALTECSGHEEIAESEYDEWIEALTIASNDGCLYFG